jgi:hypothetical protein
MTPSQRAKTHMIPGRKGSAQRDIRPVRVYAIWPRIPRPDNVPSRGPSLARKEAR